MRLVRRPRNRYVYLVNDTENRIASFALSPSGGDAWTAVRLGWRGLKAGAAETIPIAREPGEGCLYDAKIVWRGGGTFIHQGLDFCEYITYHPGRYLYAPVAAEAERRVAEAGTVR
jgi:hypothetical protein